jgi:hypothetical protein
MSPKQPEAAWSTRELAQEFKVTSVTQALGDLPGIYPGAQALVEVLLEQPLNLNVCHVVCVGGLIGPGTGPHTNVKMG